MAVMDAPPRCREQRLDALRQANDVRAKRSESKREIKAGRQSVVAILKSPPYYWETANIALLLGAQHRWGRQRSNRLLVGCRVSFAKTVGGLSGRQRHELVGRLEMLGR